MFISCDILIRLAFLALFAWLLPVLILLPNWCLGMKPLPTIEVCGTNKVTLSSCVDGSLESLFPRCPFWPLATSTSVYGGSTPLVNTCPELIFQDPFLDGHPHCQISLRKVVHDSTIHQLRDRMSDQRQRRGGVLDQIIYFAPRKPNEPKSSPVDLAEALHHDVSTRQGSPTTIQRTVKKKKLIHPEV